MSYTLYKLKFKTALHIGKGRLSDGECNIMADTLCSALCHEALHCGGETLLSKFIGYIKEGKILLSDAMPYRDEIFYIPKPYIQPKLDEKKQGDSVRKKVFKNLKYIPTDMIDTYLNGNMEPKKDDNDFGTYGLYTKAKISRSGEDTEPYSVGAFSFKKNCGLYFIVYCEDEEQQDLMDTLMDMLSYTGIGGKIYAGYGKFEFIYEDVPKALIKRLEGNYNTYMTLSISLPRESECDVVNNNACYKVEKRCGFVQSETYSDTFVKKNDFYAFVAGSCFDKKYEGDVYDVSGEGSHLVYRYAKPMMIGVI